MSGNPQENLHPKREAIGAARGVAAHFTHASSRENFLYMADSFASFGTPLFAALSRAAADDDALRAIAEHATPGQPIAYLFLCAAQYLLLRNPQEPLAQYFPSTSPGPLPLTQAYPVFREFCLRYADELKRIVSTRTLQTTAPERCGILVPALHHVHGRTGAPLNLIEIGCSAGLLLLFDRYRYEIGSTHLGDAGAQVFIKPEIRGREPRGVQLPPVASRRGVDLSPVDPGDADARLWLRALTFPDWESHHRNLGGALALRAQIPLDITRGDALAVLPGMVAAAAEPLCLFHSYCIYQWPAAVRDRFEDLICDLSKSRTIHRIGIESCGAEFGEATYLEYRGGQLAHSTVLARLEGYGRWLEWLA
ncbi:MAG: DUF2332 domain-containing protein [Gammaproteobacteria bacterium]